MSPVNIHFSTSVCVVLFNHRLMKNSKFYSEKTSLSTLTIESVDTSKEEKKMWTIIAARKTDLTLIY